MLACLLLSLRHGVLLFAVYAVYAISSLDTDDPSGSVVPSGQDRQLPAHSPALLVARRAATSHAYVHLARMLICMHIDGASASAAPSTAHIYGSHSRFRLRQPLFTL